MMDSERPIRRDYERPNEPWQCGHACRDQWCSLGPTVRGKCSAGPECQPIERNGIWQCTRSNARGGPCPEGPNAQGACCHSTEKCLPRASLRLRRSWFTYACGVATVGLVLMLMGSDFRNEAFAPGGLIGPHAQILSGDRYQERCAACHEAGHHAPLGWVSLAFGGTLPNAPPQSHKCLVCHDKQIDKSYIHNAHTIPAELLTQLQQVALASPRRQDSLWVPNHAPTQTLECALCHREHHGRLHDLTAVANAQCQTCHASQFASFGDGHPSFANWPYHDDRPMSFDHRTHLTKHFVEQHQTITCASCHPTNHSGEIDRTVSYAVACGSCHDPKIRTALGPTMPWVALPILDCDRFAELGITTPAWPEPVQGDFDGKLPLSMQLLLRTDPQVRAALKRLGNDADFANINPDDKDHVRDAAILTDGMVRLFVELSQNAEQAVLTRWPDQPLAQLIHTVPQSWWHDTFRKWLPDSISEATFQPSEAPHVTPQLGPNGVRHESASLRSGGWVRNDEQMLISYQPVGHRDPWIKAWLDLAVKDASNASSEERKMILNSPEGLACLSCHSWQGNTIRWSGGTATEESRASSTRFRHEPHLVQPQLRDCVACHQLSPLTAAHATPNTRPTGPQFVSLQKETCASCHTPHGAGDRCVQCHSYHWHGTVPPTPNGVGL